MSGRRPAAAGGSRVAFFLAMLMVLWAFPVHAGPDSAGLFDALARYRNIADNGGWPVVPATGEVLLDGDDSRLPALRRRLEITGDLPEQATDVAALDAAVRHFQRRHGLDVDGRVGAKTLLALNEPVKRRIEQIEVNLERARLSPDDSSGLHIVVNVADATLVLLDNGSRVLQRRVIVGDPQHPTPAFTTVIRAVTFNPAWNVPSSIARREILPRLKRDRNYLAANDMIILGRETDDPAGRDIDWTAMPAGRFPYRLQQRPGPKNALGLIKLEMPNPHDVYLHDTPSRSLFDRVLRFLSHGCVRVEAIEDVVRYLLRDPVRWSAEAVAESIQTGATIRVPLPASVAVHLQYWTAFVAPDGSLNFRDDVYGRDPPVRAALAAASIPKLAPAPAETGCPDN